MGVLEEGQVLVGARWKEQVDRQLEEHLERLDTGDERMKRIEAGLQTNTDITKRIETNTGSLVAWVQNITGFRNVVIFLGGLVIGLAVILGAIGVIWWWWHSGELPRRP